MREILVVGWPRSGTSWLLRLLVHYFDGPSLPVWSWSTCGKHPGFDKKHAMTNRGQQGKQVVHIIRDPRDAAVSGYFFLQGRDSPIMEDRHLLGVSSMSLLDYLETIFVKHSGWQECPIGWREYIEEWLATPDIIQVQHERLYYNREIELGRILQKMGIEVSRGRMDFAVRQSWEISGLRPIYPEQKSDRVSPAGCPGEWKRHFGKAESDFMREYCGELMARLGYD